MASYAAAARRAAAVKEVSWERLRPRESDFVSLWATTAINAIGRADRDKEAYAFVDAIVRRLVDANVPTETTMSLGEVAIREKRDGAPATMTFEVKYLRSALKEQREMIEAALPLNFALPVPGPAADGAEGEGGDAQHPQLVWSVAVTGHQVPIARMFMVGPLAAGVGKVEIQRVLEEAGFPIASVEWAPSAPMPVGVRFLRSDAAIVKTRPCTPERVALRRVVMSVGGRPRTVWVQPWARLEVRRKPMRVRHPWPGKGEPGGDAGAEGAASEAAAAVGAAAEGAGAESAGAEGAAPVDTAQAGAPVDGAGTAAAATQAATGRDPASAGTQQQQQEDGDAYMSAEEGHAMDTEEAADPAAAGEAQQRQQQQQQQQQARGSEQAAQDSPPPPRAAAGGPAANTRSKASRRETRPRSPPSAPAAFASPNPTPKKKGRDPRATSVRDSGRGSGSSGDRSNGSGDDTSDGGGGDNGSPSGERPTTAMSLDEDGYTTVRKGLPQQQAQKAYQQQQQQVLLLLQYGEPSSGDGGPAADGGDTAAADAAPAPNPSSAQ
jgi:hypothetical protein